VESHPAGPRIASSPKVSPLRKDRSPGKTRPWVDDSDGRSPGSRLKRSSRAFPGPEGPSGVMRVNSPVHSCGYSRSAVLNSGPPAFPFRFLSEDRHNGRHWSGNRAGPQGL